LSEDALAEQPALRALAALGWDVVNAFTETFGPAGTLGRDSQDQVVLVYRLRDALERLSPDVPWHVREEALEELVRDRSIMDRVRASQEVHGLIRDGYKASWRDDGGEVQEATVRYIDFRHADENDWLASNQVWIAGELHRRRADTILFVNGIPLVLMEFKEPSRPIEAAYDENLTDYRDTIPQLFVPNGFVLLSNGRQARVGASFAPWDYFWDWNIIDNDGTRGIVALDTAIQGTCRPQVLLDLIENFVSYVEKPGGLVKTVARCNQYLGVNAAIENLYRARSRREKQLGVFWHSQGSGKSLSMVWFTSKVLRLVPGDWTFVMVTDRAELDAQLHGDFVDAGAIPREARIHAESGAQLRALLVANHRYVFTLIHKFRLASGETTMPVLSDRDNVIVITDEAHRTQYDTLATNMRAALPNAAFMGFTGTPLMAGEERTKAEFGDYVSVYSYFDAQTDGATVPLYYENRTPELQLVNDTFSEDLMALLEDADLDEGAERQLARRFGQQYMLLTRPERLASIANDLVEHFVGRGFDGKAMYIGLDKAIAVQMYDLVQAAWGKRLAQLKADLAADLTNEWLADRIAFMETTDMAVVVSQSQNEIKTLAEPGLDIRPHRARMEHEDLAEKFKSPTDPLRLVFVCAMWRTGFDAPSVSTVYLDRPMKNHTLMQTITRANRVFPEKNNGLIVDYVGVFRDLEKALAIWGAPQDRHHTAESPIVDVAVLADELVKAIIGVHELCAKHRVDLVAIRDADGFEHIALREKAVEALLVSEQVRTDYLNGAALVRRLFKALMPHPSASEHQTMAAVIRALASDILALRRPKVSIEAVADAVDELLDRSIAAEGYVIDGSRALPGDNLLDLSEIDFDAILVRLSDKKRSIADRLAWLLQERAVDLARRNPTRQELVEKIESLVATYNAGSLNVEEYLRRLRDLTRSLNEEEQRAVKEGLTEEELAVFDLLTKPEPTLTETECLTVKTSAKRLLESIRDKLVLDWRRKAETIADVRQTIKELLDADLPADPYPPELFDTKVSAIFNHLIAAYGDDGSSVYASCAATGRQDGHGHA
jgi:type I restriction enzyme R subunit